MLVIDDNESDVYLIEEAIRATCLPLKLHTAKDGEEAVQFFDLVDSNPDMPCPSLVILDINLPKRRGGEVLKYMRKSRRCAEARVLVVSTSDAAKDREQMTNFGADGYFRKPSQFDEFMKLGDIVKGLLGGPALRKSSGSA